MRVLITTAYALPHLGGIEVAVDAYARELLRRGHEVVHVTSGARRAGEPDPRPAPYRVIRVPAVNALEHRFGVPFPVFTPALWRTLRRELAGADVVHAHGYLYLSSVLALPLAARVAHRPIRVLTEHVAQVPYDAAPLRAAQRTAAGSLGRICARSAEGIVVLNTNVDAEIERLAPDRPRRLIANGVDTERYHPASDDERAALRARLGWDDGVPRVLFVGRLVAKKGAPAAVEAARRAPALRLVVVGPGELRDAPDNVEVLGAQDPERLPDLYRAADVFLLPARGEGFPITAQEAMASGLPVILGRDEAYRPLLEGAADGVRMVEPDAGSVLSALRPLLADRDVRQRAGGAALAHARARFGWPRSTDEHLAFYAQLRERRAVAGR